jgi:hypothetical protein
MPESDPSEAVQMLDLLLEFFADGEHWTRGRYDDGHGRRCLIGALHYLRRKHHISTAAAVEFIEEAMPRPTAGLIYFNDHRCRSFAELRSVIVKARELALGGPKRERAAAVVRRWLLAELERERAPRAMADEHPTSMWRTHTGEELAIPAIQGAPSQAA